MANEKTYIPLTNIVEVSYKPTSKTTFALKAKAADARGSIVNPSEGKEWLTVEDVAEGFVTLEESRVRLDLGHLAYVRRLVKAGDLEGVKVELPKGPRWLVTKESIELYSKRRVERGTKRNYLLKIDPKYDGRVRKFLDSLETDWSLELAYEKKDKPATKADPVWASVIEALK